MKTINQARMRQALNSLQKARERSCGADLWIIEKLALSGLESHLGVSQPGDEAKLALELNYQEAPLDSAGLKALVGGCFRRLRRFGERQEWLYSIQRRYDVSGLISTATQLGDRQIQHEGADDDLVLIEADLLRLRAWKPLLYEAWVDYAILNRLAFYKKKDHDWLQVEAAHTNAFLPFCDWCRLWESVHYTSPSLMRRQGFDEPRSKPLHPDDQKHWEVHLTLGKGVDMDSCSTERVWFCASNAKPHL